MTNDLGSDATGGLDATLITTSGYSTSGGAVAPAPSLLADRYEVLALLGVGGMGRVYRVRDRALDEVVALKLLRKELVGAPEMVERFRREVKLARLVTSPHVVRTYDLGQHGDEYFLTMEYVEGRSLANLLEVGPLAIDEAVRIAHAACAGMAAAHAAGVLHRDLKPDNILVATGGRIAITDFGIARASATAAADTVDRFVGTPAYMAPEQVDGVAAVGPATDVYAFGAILYEMLAGCRPFVGDDPIRVALARLTAPPPDPRAHRSIPDPLANLVLRCLALAPTDRYADGATLSAALDALGAIAAMAAGATLPQPLIPIVPEKSSRSVAVLPLRVSTPDLSDLADGLAEEIVDALARTRALRVRPFAAVRAVVAADGDPLAAGRQLEVDVVVAGSLRRLGVGGESIIRISAQTIGVADGFQLSAERLDVRPEEILKATDTIAQAVARALTVELSVPARHTITDPRATELYLEGRSRCSAAWMLGPMRPAIDMLEQASALAPDDAEILAILAIATSREGFFGSKPDLARACILADRAVLIAPSHGGPWLALGLASLYNGDFATAGSALYRAVTRAPGLAMAQAALGAVLLEVGAIQEGITHLEAAIALDPSASLARSDLARGHVYENRFDVAVGVLRAHSGVTAYADITLGRFHMWRGERFEPRGTWPDVGSSRIDLFDYGEPAFEIYRHGTIDAESLQQLLETTNVPSGRLRATRAQFCVEFLVALGDRERALEYLAMSVDAGLHDIVWIERCPLLATLRTEPRFIALAATIASRASNVLTAIQGSR